MPRYVLVLLAWLLVILASCGGGGSVTPDVTEESSLSISAAGGGGQGGNTKPVAVPGAFPTEGGVSMLAHLFDDGSYDPDGEIVKWEWNFGGQGNGDGGWHDYTLMKGETWHYYDHPGTIVAHLRVTDDDGNTATKKVKIKLANDVPPDPTLSLDQLSSYEGKPGLFVTANGDWQADMEYMVDWGEGFTIPTLLTSDGSLGFYVPPFNPCAYSIRITAEDEISETVDFTILAVGELPYTQIEFAAIVADSLAGATAALDSRITALAGFPENPLTHEQYSALDALLNEVSAMSGDVEELILTLPVDEAALLQSCYQESGVLELLNGLAALNDGKGTSSQWVLHGVLFDCDLLSFAITNLMIPLEFIEFPLYKIALFKNFKFVKMTKAATGTLVVLKVLDFIIDTIVPSDIKAVSFGDERYDEFLMPDVNPVHVGESKQYPIIGRFTNQDKIYVRTFSELMELIVDRFFKDIMKLGGGSSLAEELRTFLLKFASKINVHLAAILLEGYPGEGEIVLPPWDVEMDMSIYALGLEDMLQALSLPRGFVMKFLEFIDILGVEYTFIEPVIIDDESIATYSYAQEAVTGVNSGETLLCAKVFVYRDRYFLDAIRYCDAVILQSPWTNVIVEESSGDLVICYSAKVDGQLGIWTMEANGGNQHLVLTLPDATNVGCGSWSPDKSKIAYFANEDGGSDLYIVNTDGTGKHRVTTDGAVYYQPDWEDNDTLVFMTTVSGEREIGRINIDGTGKEILSTPGDGYHENDPKLSPDRTKIAVARGSSSTSSLVVYTADYPSFSNLTPVGDVSGDGDRNPDWSTDGRIAWNTVSGHDIYIADVDGSNRELITTGTTWEAQPVFSADNSKLVYRKRIGSGSVRYNLWIVDLITGDQEQLVNAQQSIDADWYVPV